MRVLDKKQGEEYDQFSEESRKLTIVALVETGEKRSLNLECSLEGNLMTE